MIPQFPKFKKINVHDRGAIESMTDQEQPYSTFNFTNLWAWDTKHTRLVSRLNNNLVLLFTDYKTGEPFFVLNGKYEIHESTEKLFQFAKKHGLSPTLRFMPEHTAKFLTRTKFIVIEDPDNSDYIFSTKRIAESLGNELKSKRVLSKRFVRENPTALFEARILDQHTIHEQIHAVLKQWENNKKSNGKDYDLHHEEVALGRMLKSIGNHNLILSSVSVDGSIVGFSIDEILPHKYAMAHFIKADTAYKGIYEFINERTAEFLHMNGVELWNWQQDLGIPGLRRLKQSYRPTHILKKYSITLLENVR